MSLTDPYDKDDVRFDSARRVAKQAADNFRRDYYGPGGEGTMRRMLRADEPHNVPNYSLAEE